MNATGPQIQRLQVLYRQYEAHSLDAGATRVDRLAWAAARIGRRIDSFKQLHIGEAKQLIDGLQAALGVALPARPKRRTRTIKDGEKAGTEGRHDQIHAEATLVGDTDIRRIQRDMDALGWNQARLDAFLASPKGPLGGRKEIRTLGDANRVHWALKRMIPHAAKPGQPTHPQEAHSTAK